MGEQRNSGKELEQRVATWMRRQGATKVSTRVFINGLAVKRPYEIDVWAHFKGSWGRQGKDIWIECKDQQASIKRKDIGVLVHKARDIYQACQAGREPLYFDKLFFVSTSPYDPDAVAEADRFGVTCFHYDGKGYRELTRGDWQHKARWLQEVEGSH